MSPLGVGGTKSCWSLEICSRLYNVPEYGHLCMPLASNADIGLSMGFVMGAAASSGTAEAGVFLARCMDPKRESGCATSRYRSTFGRRPLPCGRLLRATHPGGQSEDCLRDTSPLSPSNSQKSSLTELTKLCSQFVLWRLSLRSRER